MFVDIVFPNKNEEKFIVIAEKLGIEALCFVYDKNLPKELPKSNNVKLFFGLLCKRKKVEKVSLFFSDDIEAARETINQKSADVLFSIESSKRKDFIHARCGGLNHVLCKLSNEKGVSIAFNFNDSLTAESKLRAKLLGRMQQNVKLCEKYKVNMVVASFAKKPMQMRSVHEIKAFVEFLGMNTTSSKNCLVSLGKILNK